MSEKKSGEREGMGPHPRGLTNSLFTQCPIDVTLYRMADQGEICFLWIWIFSIIKAICKGLGYSITCSLFMNIHTAAVAAFKKPET